MHEYLEHLIWRQSPRALRLQPLADRRTWSGAVQHELVQFGMGTAVGQPARPDAPDRTVAVVMIVKDDEDIIEHNLRWLYFIGLRRFVLADNLSADASRDILPDFQRDHPDAECLIISDPLIKHDPSEKLSGFSRFAISIWPDLEWVMPIDAEEFVIPQSGLKRLHNVPAEVDAITVPKVVHFRHRIAACLGDSALLRMACRSPLFCVPPKLILRARVSLTMSKGTHQLMSFQGGEPRYDGGFAYGFYYRAFPIRSFEHFIRKVRNEGLAALARRRYAGAQAGGEHWLRYYERLRSGDEIRLLDLFEKEWVKTSLPTGWVMDPFGGAPIPS